MKTTNAYRYLIALFFSLLIIFAGAGVAVIHCYCISCQTEHVCSEESHDHEAAAHHSHEEGCCAATIYKIDLLKGSDPLLQFTAPAVMLPAQLAVLLKPMLTESLSVFSCQYPPSPPQPRRFLALYAVFII